MLACGKVGEFCFGLLLPPSFLSRRTGNDLLFCLLHELKSGTNLRIDKSILSYSIPRSTTFVVSVMHSFSSVLNLLRLFQCELPLLTLTAARLKYKPLA